MLIKKQRTFFSVFKTLLRFDKQQTNWKRADFEFHANAFLNGLRENDISKKALFWMDSNHTMEYVMALAGCDMGNVETASLNQLTGDNFDANSLQKALKESKAELLLLSPNFVQNQKKRIQLLYDAFHHLQNHDQSDEPEIGSLKKIVHTGFYS